MTGYRRGMTGYRRGMTRERDPRYGSEWGWPRAGQNWSDEVSSVKYLKSQLLQGRGRQPRELSIYAEAIVFEAIGINPA